ncbi:MAG: hypothetical protein NTW21_17760 [Verrucomicrobia bacterium]|nr:hypothetical protein [Verrucomicrobiota bacterium]
MTFLCPSSSSVSTASGNRSEAEIACHRQPAGWSDSDINAFSTSRHPPPLDIETFEPIDPPWRAIQEWLPDDEPPDRWDQHPHPAWQPVAIPLDGERTLVLDAT